MNRKVSLTNKLPTYPNTTQRPNKVVLHENLTFGKALQLCEMYSEIQKLSVNGQENPKPKAPPPLPSPLPPAPPPQPPNLVQLRSPLQPLRNMHTLSAPLSKPYSHNVNVSENLFMQGYPQPPLNMSVPPIPEETNENHSKRSVLFYDHEKKVKKAKSKKKFTFDVGKMMKYIERKNRSKSAEMKPTRKDPEKVTSADIRRMKDINKIKASFELDKKIKKLILVDKMFAVRKVEKKPQDDTSKLMARWMKKEINALITKICLFWNNRKANDAVFDTLIVAVLFDFLFMLESCPILTHGSDEVLYTTFSKIFEKTQSWFDENLDINGKGDGIEKE